MHRKHTSQVYLEDGAIKLVKGFQQLLVSGDGDMVTLSICRRREKLLASEAKARTKRVLTGPRNDDVFCGHGWKNLRDFLHKVRVVGGDVLIQREATNLLRFLLPASSIQECFHGESHGGGKLPSCGKLLSCGILLPWIMLYVLSAALLL